MKNRISKYYYIGLFGIVVTILLFVLFTTKIFATDSRIYYADNELKEISFEKWHIEGICFYYNDMMLLDRIGESEPSGELSLASIGLSVAAYDQGVVTNLFEKMGYHTLYTDDYYFYDTTHDNNDVVAYSIAERYINYNGELYRILVIPVRGTPSTCEWYSDFNIGLSGQWDIAGELPWLILSLGNYPLNLLGHHLHQRIMCLGILMLVRL